MVSQGLQCVKSSVSSTTNLYTQALLAYTFSLAGNMNIRNILLKKLDQQAIVSGMLAMLAFALFFATLHSMQNFPDQGSNPLGCQGSPFHFLSWCVACRILVPWPGIEPRSKTVNPGLKSSESQPLDSHGSSSFFEIVKRCEKFP